MWDRTYAPGSAKNRSQVNMGTRLEEAAGVAFPSRVALKSTGDHSAPRGPSWVPVSTAICGRAIRAAAYQDDPASEHRPPLSCPQRRPRRLAAERVEKWLVALDLGEET